MELGALIINLEGVGSTFIEFKLITLNKLKLCTNYFKKTKFLVGARDPMCHSINPLLVVVISGGNGNVALGFLC